MLLRDMQVDINNLQLILFHGNARAGTLCVAKWLNDNQYYRGTVLNTLARMLVIDETDYTEWCDATNGIANSAAIGATAGATATENNDDPLLTAVQDELECPICYEYMIDGPIRECIDGHVICQTCLAKYPQNCPQCLGPPAEIMRLWGYEVMKMCGEICRWQHHDIRLNVKTQNTQHTCANIEFNDNFIWTKILFGHSEMRDSSE